MKQTEKNTIKLIFLPTDRSSTGKCYRAPYNTPTGTRAVKIHASQLLLW